MEDALPCAAAVVDLFALMARCLVVLSCSWGVAQGVQLRTARRSSSRINTWSSPSIFTSVPEYLPNRTRSPAFTSSGWTLPSFRVLP